jgi:2-keto-4-pentenoate hydratase/2-oxohepta-3-ene-1,7-dioic acid hydratase in catechol pathway
MGARVKYVRFRQGDCAAYGELEHDSVIPLSGPPWNGGVRCDDPVPLAGLTLLAPCEPSKIVCVGQNYKTHAEEMGKEVPPEPLLFLKPPSAVIGPGDAIILPPQSELVHHEAELAVVIGRRAKGVCRGEAMGYVLGYTCINDVTARDLQRRDGQWSRAKGFDTFAPLGPCIDCGVDPSAVAVRCRVNGELRQDGCTDDLAFGVEVLIEYISAAMTLHPGDVIATGTPSGVGPLVDGDTVTVQIPGIGELTNPVRGATPVGRAAEGRAP